MKKINRKSFLKKAAVAGIGVSSLISACNSESIVPTKNTSPNIITNKKYKWNMVTTWPPNFPILGEGCNFVADWIREMSGGRLDIKVYGGGELIPALEVWDAVASGTAHMGAGCSYYWAGKTPAAQFFASIPFGMNAQQHNAWLISGGGLQLWEELYAKYNLIPMIAGNTGVQMGGWFNKEINTIADFKGLKMRIPGLGGKVLEKAGGTAVLSAGGEIYTNLERGVIDATEWIGPFHDYKMGFHKIAKYYYSPGWHECGTALELMINKPKMDSLPKDLQAIIRHAAERLNMWTWMEFEAKNAEFLATILNEASIEVRSFSPEILDKLRGFTAEAINDITSKDVFAQKVYDSYDAFRSKMTKWSALTEKLYYNTIQK